MSNISIVTNEKVLLSILLKNPVYVYQMTKNYFLSEVGKNLFNTISKLYGDHKRINDKMIIVHANNDLVNQETLDNLKAYEDYHIDDFKVYYDELIRKFAKNELRVDARKIIMEAESKADLTLAQTKRLRDQLNKNIQLIESDSELLLTLEEATSRYKVEFLKRMKGEIKYDLGCSYLNQHVGYPALPGEITSLYGPPGSGKSAYALNLFIKQMNKQIPSLYLNLENSLYMTFNRVFQMKQDIDIDILRECHAEENFFLLDKLNYEQQILNKIKTSLVSFRPDIALDDLPEIIEKAKAILGVDYLVITIDLAGMLGGFGQKPNEVMAAMDYLSALAKLKNVHFILLFQTNRKAEDQVQIKVPDDLIKLRPKPNHLYGSSAVLQRSRVLLSVFRKKHFHKIYFPDDPMLNLIDDIAEIQFQKQNQGDITRLNYLYDAKTFNWYKYNFNKQLLNKVSNMS